jgi:hypothetical protein
VLDSPWLEIAIGVVVVWFILSIVVSALNELINRLFAVRSKQLWATLNQMLDGNAQLKPAWRQSVAIIANRGRPQNPTKRDPLNDTVYERLYSTSTIQALEDRTSPDVKTKIHNIPRTVFSQALIEMGIRESSAPTVGTYLAGLPGPLGTQLNVIWTEAQNDLNRFRIGVETWFDAQMDRLSAQYRAQVRFVMLGIGVVVAIAGFGLGIRTDSLGLVSDLQRDESLRTGLNDLATQVSKEDIATIAAKGCPPATASATSTTAATTATSTTTTTTPEYVCVARGLATYQNLNLIFDDRGVTPGAPDRSFGDVWSDFWHRFGSIFSHWRSLLGVAITAAALSFGASFWWNVLRRLVGLRQNGKTSPSA